MLSPTARAKMPFFFAPSRSFPVVEVLIASAIFKTPPATATSLRPKSVAQSTVSLETLLVSDSVLTSRVVAK